MTTRIKRLRGRDEGQALVELALVLPLLLILIFGVIDFGIAINQYNDVTNLANVAVRQLSVASSSSSWTAPDCPNGTASTSLTNYVQCMGAQDNSALAAATVCPYDNTTSSSTGVYTTGDTVDVQVNTNYNWLKLFVGGVGKLGGVVSSTTTSIGSTAYMRQEATTTSSSSAESWITSGATCS